MLVNIIHHRQKEWRFRCGDCGCWFASCGEPILAIKGILNHVALYLPLCETCRYKRIQGLLDHAGSFCLYVFGFSQNLPRLEAPYTEAL